jgi:hypothetical protein
MQERLFILSLCATLPRFFGSYGIVRLTRYSLEGEGLHNLRVITQYLRRGSAVSQRM